MFNRTLLFVFLATSIFACAGEETTTPDIQCAPGTALSAAGDACEPILAADAGTPDSAAPDAATATDAGTPDSAAPDAATATDAGTPDSAAPDAATATDAGTPDSAAPDAATATDAGTPDSAAPDAATATDIKAVSLAFRRIPNELGLDAFDVTATLTLDDVAQAGESPNVTLGRGTNSTTVDEGDGSYVFRVTPNQTGEHSVEVCYDEVCETRTALVLKVVHPDLGQPMSVSGLVNTEGYEDGITITPDGQYLFTQTGHNYASGSFVYDAPREIGGCGGDRLVPSVCTHPWINEVVGPYTAPERPGFHDGRIDSDGTLLHNANSWGMTPGQVGLFSQATMFYGFKRQADGTFAEPFFIAFDDENDALAGPFGMSFVMTGEDTATMIFSNRNETGQVMVDSDNNGSFETPSGFDLHTLEVTLGQNTSLGELVASGTPVTPPVRGAHWPTTPVHLSATGTDGIFGTQGNGHLFAVGGNVQSIWTDDEYDFDLDAGEISVYVLTSGSFPDGDFEKTVLPSKINNAGIENREIMPFFTGAGLYFALDTAERPPEVWFASYSGPQTSAGYADNANWSEPENILGFDETDTSIGSVVAIGEPTVATVEGIEYIYFVYVVKRGVDPLTGYPDVNFQAGFVPRIRAASSELLIPRLGVYTVKTDGSELALLTDTGTRAYTHVRSNPDNDWLTATRYNNDLDGNGLAMEGEDVGGSSPHYGGTEIILFRSSSPNDVFTVSADGLVCDAPSAVCANSSWTSDGKLILLNSHDGSGSNDWIKRVTFTTVPEAASVESLVLPPQLFAPLDPHQYGDSATGVIVFSALFNQGTPPEQKWMRPLWKMPATGAANFATDQTEFVGCSTCVSEGGACCSENVPELVVAGTNDARISHDGQTVLWMQSSREVTGDILGVTLNPYRQFIKPLVGGVQAALDDSLAHDTTTHAYGEWSPDDAQIAYWELLVSGNSTPTFRVREELFVADVDGTNRQAIPLPEELCAAHPSYLDQDTLVFTGWKCGGANCSCHPAAL